MKIYLKLKNYLKNKKINFRKLIADSKVSKVSIVGGNDYNSRCNYRMFNALAKKYNIIVISTSEIKISVLVNRKDLNHAIKVLHKEFNLEK